VLIVVEGCDRTGKTSLCERLAADLGGEIVHWDRPLASDPITEYVNPLAGYLPGGGEDVFVDRHYLGELVWPHIFQRPSIMTETGRNEIERWLRLIGALCVLAVRDPVELQEACEDEPCGELAWVAQIMFEIEAEASTLTWMRYEHGRELQYRDIVMNARLLEESRTEELDRALSA
jgi:hypothetical protein